MELIEKFKKLKTYFEYIKDDDSLYTINEAIQALESKEPKPSDAVEFLDAIREYERESGNKICYDERTSDELYQQFLTTKQK